MDLFSSPERPCQKFPDQLTQEEARQELIRLTEEISEHDKLYYQQDKPKISDAEYDLLRKRNAEIEKLFPTLVLENSPSRRIGAAPLEKFDKVSHRVPMLSLSNAFDESDIDDFIEKISRFLGVKENAIIKFFCEPKIDGLSFNARFENGIFIQGATRGDGLIGEDITINMKTIHGFPHKLRGDDVPEVIEVRGEVYMSHNDFTKLNKKREEDGEEPFSNPRNAAAGSLRQLDSNITAERNLHYFAYGFGEFSKNIISGQHEFMNSLSKWGFATNKLFRLCETKEEILNFYEEIKNKRDNLNYDIDGMVCKVDSFEMQARLGHVSRSPRWAIAFKFPAEQAKTIIEKIIIQVGRTGALTPVAVLKPINVGGVVVSRATLHNEEEIKRKDIREGDTVTIQRAGDVIPQVVGVDYDKRTNNSIEFKFPDTCPACGSKAFREADEAVIRCNGGIICPAQAMERIRHFVSRNAFDIDGMGEKQVELFFEKGLVKKPSDVFKLEEKDSKSDQPIMNWEGWGDKSANNLFAAIRKSRTISLERFIYSLGIRHVGEVTAKLLAKNYISPQSWFKVMLEIKDEQLQAYNDIINIDGIGKKVAVQLIDFFNEKHNVEEVEELLRQIEIKDYQVNNINSKISGKTIVFTGSMERTSRDEAKAKAENLGAKVASAVSKKTDFVVGGADAGSKLKKAGELGVKIITEEEWEELIKN